MKSAISLSNYYYNKALNSIHQLEFTTAESYLKKSITYYSHDINILNLLGLVEYHLSKFNEASYYWQKSMNIDAENNNAVRYLEYLNSAEFMQYIKHYNEGIIELHNHEYLRASEIFSALLAEYIFPEIFFMRGISYIANGELKKAHIDFNRAIECDGSNYKFIKYRDDTNNQINKSLKKQNLLSYVLISIILLSFSITAWFINADKGKYHTDSITYQSEVDNLTKEKNELIMERVNLRQLLDIRTAELTSLKDKTIQKEGINELDSNNKFYHNSENEIFSNALSYHDAGDYTNAITHFYYLYSSGTETVFKAESTFYLAVIYERINDFDNAEAYYIDYIENYPNLNYYDDSLYNYGVMSYKLGNKKEAAEIALQLKNEVPTSIFNNSIIDTIINN